MQNLIQNNIINKVVFERRLNNFAFYGTIKVIMLPEAMLLHELDMMDGRMYMFEQSLTDLLLDGMNDKISGLGARVYKLEIEEMEEKT